MSPGGFCCVGRIFGVPRQPQERSTLGVSHLIPPQRKHLRAHSTNYNISALACLSQGDQGKKFQNGAWERACEPNTPTARRGRSAIVGRRRGGQHTFSTQLPPLQRCVKSSTCPTDIIITFGGTLDRAAIQQHEIRKLSKPSLRFLVADQGCTWSWYEFCLFSLLLSFTRDPFTRVIALLNFCIILAWKWDSGLACCEIWI